MDAKLERSVVIQGFMKAHHEIEKSGKGFGKGYWGNKWRFKIFDGFYTHPQDPETGLVVSFVYCCVCACADTACGTCLSDPPS
jgi:hypothetical protein